MLVTDLKTKSCFLYHCINYLTGTSRLDQEKDAYTCNLVSVIQMHVIFFPRLTLKFLAIFILFYYCGNFFHPIISRSDRRSFYQFTNFEPISERLSTGVVINATNAMRGHDLIGKPT